MRARHSHLRAVLRLPPLFGRRPNRVIEFACFNSKLQQARNTCERKQAKRRECPPRGVSQHSIYIQISKWRPKRVLVPYVRLKVYDLSSH